MIRIKTVIMIFFFSLLLCPAPALEYQSAELGLTAPVGTQWLILIGISEYQHWLPLEYPRQDAERLKEVLQRRYFIDQVCELYDDQATRAGIVKLLEDLQEKPAVHDSVLIFYSGHGYLDPRTELGYWIPYDAGRDKMNKDRWLNNAELRGYLAGIKASHLCLISDSCFSGKILEGFKTDTLPEFDNAYFRKAYAHTSRQVLTSGAVERVPDDSEFARQLRAVMEKQTGLCIDPLLLYTEVRAGITKTEPRYGTLAGAGHQQDGSFLLFLKDRLPTQLPPPTPRIPQPSGIVVVAHVGSLEVKVATAGELRIDGAKVQQMRKASTTTISNLPVGQSRVEMHYANGHVEGYDVVIERNKAVPRVFSYVPKPLPDFLVKVEGGIFRMGSESKDAFDDEKPVHQVTQDTFYLGKHEVTQGEWERVMGYNPSYFTGDGYSNLPVEEVSWEDAVDFCNKLSEQEGLIPCYSGSGKNITCDFTADGYRLPTEAEWEYAARGGKQSQGYVYSGSNDVNDVAWYLENSNKTTHAVNQKKANELGLFDMSGNVWEWCWDWYVDEYLAEAQINPRGPVTGDYRVVRGGGWSSFARYCRSAYRYGSGPGFRSYGIGFRLARGH